MDATEPLLPRNKEEQHTLEENKEEYLPVQQVCPDAEVTKKEVRQAVRELNPDVNTLDRG